MTDMSAYAEQFSDERLRKEISYYMIWLLLRKLLEQQRLAPTDCQKVNVAIAEKWGVLPLDV